jgi:hypothetical protein
MCIIDGHSHGEPWADEDIPTIIIIFVVCVIVDGHNSPK